MCTWSGADQTSYLTEVMKAFAADLDVASPAFDQRPAGRRSAGRRVGGGGLTATRELDRSTSP